MLKIHKTFLAEAFKSYPRFNPKSSVILVHTKLASPKLDFGFWELHRFFRDLGINDQMFGIGKLRVLWVSFWISVDPNLGFRSHLDVIKILRGKSLDDMQFVKLVSVVFSHIFTPRSEHEPPCAVSLRRFLKRKVERDYFAKLKRMYVLDCKRLSSSDGLLPKTIVPIVSFSKFLLPTTAEIEDLILHLYTCLVFFFLRLRA